MKRILALCACLLVLCAFPLPALAAEAEPAPYTSMPETTPDEEEPAKPPGMLESTTVLGQALFSGIWNLFDNQFPGFNFTFRQFWIAVALCGLSIRVIRFIFSFAWFVGSHVAAVYAVVIQLKFQSDKLKLLQHQ